jgi:hypothetical protein
MAGLDPLSSPHRHVRAKPAMMTGASRNNSVIPGRRVSGEPGISCGVSISDALQRDIPDRRRKRV